MPGLKVPLVLLVQYLVLQDRLAFLALQRLPALLDTRGHKDHTGRLEVKEVPVRPVIQALRALRAHLDGPRVGRDRVRSRVQ